MAMQGTTIVRNQWFAKVALSVACAVVKAGCGAAPQAPPAEIDVEHELGVMFACAAESIEQLGQPLAARHEGLRWLAGPWVPTTTGRARITARIFVHPGYGPGMTVRVQREQWAGDGSGSLDADVSVGADGSGWDAALSDSDDAIREQEVLASTRLCWERRRAE